MVVLGTKLCDQRGLPDTTPTIDDNQFRLVRAEGGIERIEFVAPVVEGHYFDNDYCDNDLLRYVVIGGYSDADVRRESSGVFATTIRSMASTTPATIVATTAIQRSDERYTPW